MLYNNNVCYTTLYNPNSLKALYWKRIKPMPVDQGGAPITKTTRKWYFNTTSIETP